MTAWPCPDGENGISSPWMVHASRPDGSGIIQPAHTIKQARGWPGWDHQPLADIEGPPAHPEELTYPCCLPTLGGWASYRRTGDLRLS